MAEACPGRTGCRVWGSGSRGLSVWFMAWDLGCRKPPGKPRKGIEGLGFKAGIF